MQNVVYTEAEVEDMLKLPRGRIRSWRRDGFGPAWVQLGRERRYRWNDIDAFLKANAVEFITNQIPPWAKEESDQLTPPWMHRAKV